MEDRYKELLASSLILLSEKMKKDYESEKFKNVLNEELGMDDDEIEDIIEVMNELA